MNIDELIYHNVYVCSASVISAEPDLFAGTAGSYNIVVVVEIEDNIVRAYYTGYPDKRKPKLEELRVRRGCRIATAEYYLTRRPVELHIARIIGKVIKEYEAAGAGENGE